MATGDVVLQEMRRAQGKDKEEGEMGAEGRRWRWRRSFHETNHCDFRVREPRKGPRDPGKGACLATQLAAASEAGSLLPDTLEQQ